VSEPFDMEAAMEKADLARNEKRESLPDCPRCGGEMWPCSGYVTGIETFWSACEDCDYQTNPE